MKTHGSSGPRSGRGIADWLQRIAQAWVHPTAQGTEQGNDALPPQGTRSGRGTASLVPFLAEGRNTRPADLE